MNAVVSASVLAKALGDNEPTPEQAAVIEADPTCPALVVAGAGAGKTTTMAARVVWLVANGHARPEQVLGLTFTRKAAQQLSKKIRGSLNRLKAPDALSGIGAGAELREILAAGEPEISTYHSYAGRLLTEYGLLLPIEPGARLLGETELWQLAYRVVSGWDRDLETDKSPATITEAVLGLYGQLAEHLVDLDRLDETYRELEHLVHTLPPGPGKKGAPNQKLLSVVDAQQRRVALLPLVIALRDTLLREGLLDFGSQMSLAAQVADRHREEVGGAERERFRAVLLDEYQDTGNAQRVLLASLFGVGVDGSGTGSPGHTLALTAVGDPIQSIYGWRGASAVNLDKVVEDFPRPDGTPAPRLEMLTSWRNPPEALTLANAVSEPLRARGAKVGTLNARPGAVAGDIRAALLPDVGAERRWVAEQIAQTYAAARAEGKAVPSAAVLVRRNADSAPLAEALREQGLPVEVVGLGGLLDEPEVRDVVAMLRLIADPLAGSAAMRILTGARWRIGAADLAVLASRARALAIRTAFAEAGVLDDAETLDRGLAAALHGEHADQAGLADAIADPGPAEAYSAAGYHRITQIRRELASLRERLGQPLTELVAEVERTLRIGIESVARRPDEPAGAGSVAGREHLDAFADVVAGYASLPNATLTGMLAYLAAAESIEDGFDSAEVAVHPERVQVLTAHKAKGLEWQVVAVPHIVDGVFPSDRASSTWLGDVTELPPRLRGDAAVPPDGSDPGANHVAVEGFPLLDLDGVNTRKDLEEAIERHKKALAARRLDEDRRLLYVALTRTERVLLVSGHHWPDEGKAKGPSGFLLELRERIEAGVGEVQEWAPTPEHPEAEHNPLSQEKRAAPWPPVQPLGARQRDVEDGAELVRHAVAEFASTTTTTTTTAASATKAATTSAEADEDGEPAEDEPDVDDPEGWARDVEVLLAERAQRLAPQLEVPLPHQLSVSQLVELRADPDLLAQRLRRPLPYPPNPFARRGTAFHAWVERRFGATRLLDLDELPGAADSENGPVADLAELQEAFLRSPWAQRNPAEVEVPFETSIAGTVIRGRIDAVFRDADGGWTVVDWKTGGEPTAEQRRSVLIQLAAYRVAWAELAGGDEPVPLTSVRAAFHYVRTGRTIAPDDLPDREELGRLIESAGADRHQ
ncbi:ATP-dependent helicase [Speluncibacter jeojiensis]|uniref:DNA 3'-5' helicase n=1 Tax=Speluncibacter jeojiensis TaxID=2710754 RepID=A0A9X4LWS8_9ACTN|nr:DEAD/DEAH box helicase [Corynebacteriales bacterium D3-21]